MLINFIGLFGRSDSGEVSDETHLVAALEQLGHSVRRIPRDEWREYVLEGAPKGKYAGVPTELAADLTLCAKWHHFFDGRFLTAMKVYSDAPVWYWVWDSVDLGIPWHKAMCQAADLYLSGELGRAAEFRKNDIRFYYFQMDSVDGATQQYRYNTREATHIMHDVVYLGTYDNQGGRMDLLKAINAVVPLAVYSQNWQMWQQEGFAAHPPVYGEEANQVMAKSKIVLGTSCDPHLFGYWSNRVGRTLANKSLLLQQYVPGMESSLHHWVEYFSDAPEAIAKLQYLLTNSNWRQRQDYPVELWRSNQKMQDLLILAERYLKENNGALWQLP